jgi:uncharacterized protein (DUF697 family)
MAAAFSLGTTFALVREVAKSKDRPLLVAGKLAPELARELRAGGDASAVRTGGAAEDVEALVYTLGDAVTNEDERMLKLARRARIPTIVVAAGRNVPEQIPFVLATDVVRVEPGHGFPLDTIARSLASKLGEDATSLARHLPVLRDAVCEHLIESFARRNAVIGASTFVYGVDLPVLTRNQLRLVLRIFAAHGLPVDNQRAPEIAATIGTGIGFRALARKLLARLPLSPWLVKGGVAYGGTKAVGEAAVQYARARTTLRSPAAASASSS